MIAVVPVRRGELAVGGVEAIAEAGGVGLLVGEGATEAARGLSVRADGDSETGPRELKVMELVTHRLSGCAAALAPHVNGTRVVVLPASPDGRDLAPRLAAALGWPLLAGAIRVTQNGASLARLQGRQIAHFVVDGPFVATLLPGSRRTVGEEAPAVLPILDGLGPKGAPSGGGPSDARPRSLAGIVELEAPNALDLPEAELIEVLEADPAVMDLAEAGRILGAGAGIGGPDQVATLQEVAARLGASVGATRVVTDAGWLPHDRQIGTTGVSVRPRCYVAFGVSGAAQHVGGLGTPLHVISVNTDRSSPMMAMADLALVTDARELLDVLARKLAPDSTAAVADVPAGLAGGAT